MFGRPNRLAYISSVERGASKKAGRVNRVRSIPILSCDRMCLIMLLLAIKPVIKFNVYVLIIIIAYYDLSQSKKCFDNDIHHGALATCDIIITLY